MDAVTDLSTTYDSCESFFNNVVSSKQAGATHYTLMRVCCDPTQAGDNCNAMTDTVINSLWLGLPGGPADVAALVGSVYADAGPGPSTTVKPLALTPGTGDGSGDGSGSPSSATPAPTYSAGALAGGIIGAAVGSALLTGLITWHVMRRRNAVGTADVANHGKASDMK